MTKTVKNRTRSERFFRLASIPEEFTRYFHNRSTGANAFGSTVCMIAVVVLCLVGNLPAAQAESGSENSETISNEDSVGESSDSAASNLPEIDVVSLTRSVREGEAAKFEVRSSEALDESLEINIFVDESQQFISGRMPRTVTLPAGKTKVEVAVATDDDEVDEYRGLVNLTVDPGDGYLVANQDTDGNANATARAWVYDNDTLELSLETEATTAYLNLLTRFVVKSTMVSNRDIEIRLRDNSGYFDGPEAIEPATKILRAGKTELNVDVAVNERNFYLFGENAYASGDLEVTIVPNSYHPDHYTVDSSASSVSVPLDVGVLESTRPDVLPELTIRRKTQDKQFESEKMWFFVESLTTPPTQDLIVMLDVSENGNNFLDRYVSNAVKLRKGFWKYYFTIDLDDDDVSEPHGWVTVRILPGNGYTVAEAPDDRYSVKIIDDDEESPPQVGVESNDAFIYEGQEAAFTLILTTNNTKRRFNSPLEVKMVINWEGDFMRTNESKEHTVRVSRHWIKNEQLFGSFNLTTVDDSVTETDGWLEVLISPGEGYSVDGMKDKASIRILDNDNHTDPIPEISIVKFESNNGFVDLNEGETAKFKVLASSAKAEQFDVNVDVEHNGGFLDAATIPTSVTFEANEKSADLTINTVNDYLDEADDTISVVVESGEGYTIAAAPRNSASVRVYDNDHPPVLELVELSKVISEGDSAKYWVRTFLRKSATDLTINYTVANESGDFVENPGQRTVTLPAGAGETSFEVQTRQSETTALDGRVVVSLATGDGYVLADRESVLQDVQEVGWVYKWTRSQSLTLTVLNQNATPITTVSIESMEPNVKEGEAVEFRLIATPAPSETIEVKIDMVGDHVELSQEGEITVELASGTRSTTFTVDALDNTEVDIHGIAYATVAEGTGYSPVVAPYNQAVVVVRNDDYAIATIFGGEAITEGENAEFTIHLDREMKYDLEVRVFINEGDASFLTTRSPHIEWVVFPKEQTTHTFTIATADDTVVEDDGVITASLIGHFNHYPTHRRYFPDFDGSYQATVDVRDNDGESSAPVVVSISSADISVSENRGTEFVLTASEVLEEELDVLINVSQTGDFLYSQTGDQVIEIEAGRNSATYIPSLYDDQIDEQDGSITVTVKPGEGYVPANSPDDFHIVQIIDDDVPQIEVSYTGNSVQVSEGADVAFELEANIAPAIALTVNLELAQEGEFLTSSVLAPVSIPAGDTTKAFVVGTVNDLLDENNGAITVTVGSGEGYVPAPSPDNFKTVQILDDDMPEVEIFHTLTGGVRVSEGESAEFELKVEIAPKDDLSVNLEVTQVGEFLKNSTLGPVVIPAGEFSKVFVVETVDDAMDESNGEITVTVVSGTGYTIDAENGSKFTIIEDNDDPVPAMTIEADSADVVEGGEATFNISSTHNIKSDIAVNVRVTLTGNFFGDQESGIVEVPFESGSDAQTLVINSVDDDVEELGGTVVAEILPDDPQSGELAAYQVVGTENIDATVNVADNDDKTEISIASVATPVSEGTDAVFTLTSTKTMLNTLTINFEVEDIRSVIEGTEPVSKELPAGQNSIELAIATDDDQVNEESGRIKVTLQSGTGYEVAATPDDNAFVDVNDNDQVKLAVSISNEGYVGENAWYGKNLTLREGLPHRVYFHTIPYNTTIGRDLTINFTATDTRNKLVKPGRKTVVLPAGEISVLTSLPTVCDENGEPESILTVRLDSGEGYELASAAEAPLFVGRDSLPIKDVNKSSQGRVECPDPNVITISAIDQEVTEGDNAQFKITGKYLRGAQTQHVNVKFENTRGNFMIGPETRVVRILTGEYSSEYITINTRGNDIDNENGIVRASIAEGDGYVAGSPSFAEISVRDDDGEAGVPTTTFASLTASSNAISEGEEAVFTISLNRTLNADEAVHVDVGWVTEGDFLTRTDNSDVVSILAGNDKTQLRLSTVDDDAFEPDGGVTATLLEGEGYDIDEDLKSVRISIRSEDAPQAARSEALHQNLLPNLLNQNREHSVDELASRIDFAFNNSGESRFELGGAESIEDMISRGGELLNGDEVDLTTFLSDSSFSINLTPDLGPGTTTLWGSGFSENISDDGTTDSFDWQGNSFTGLIGLDTRIGNGLLTGVVTEKNESSIDFVHGNADGEVEGLYRLRMTNIQPYLAWASSDLETQLHGSVGYGLGEVEIDYEHFDAEVADVSQYSVAIGGNDLLYSSESLFGDGQSELRFKAEGWMARQFVRKNDSTIVGASITANTLRMTAEGTHQRTLESGTLFSPTMSVGTRWDGGNGDTGIGLVMKGGSSYEDPHGLDVSSSGRILLSNDSANNEQGLSGVIGYDAGRDGIGMISTISPTWGIVDESGVDQIWEGSNSSNDRFSLNSQGGVRLESEIGYGFTIVDGRVVVIPNLVTGLYEGGGNRFGVGSHSTFGSGMGIEFEAVREERSNGVLDGKLRFEGNLEW